MFEEINKLVEEINKLVEEINVKGIRDEKEVFNKKKTKVIKCYTKKIVKLADDNKDLLTKEIFRLLLEKYENNLFEIINSNKEEQIKIFIPPVEEGGYPLERETNLIWKYNKTIDENSAENKVYFHVIENNGIKKWIPVKLDLAKIKKMDLIDKIEWYGNIMILVDIKKIRNLTIKAHNNELDTELFDKDIIEMLNKSYLKMIERKEMVNTFIKEMKSTYVEKISLDVIKKLINDYKNNPYTDRSNMYHNINYIVLNLWNRGMPNEYEFYIDIINYSFFHTYAIEILCYPITEEDTITPKIKYYPFIIQDLYNSLYKTFKSLDIVVQTYIGRRRIGIAVDTAELEDYIISIQETNQKKLTKERKSSS